MSKPNIMVLPYTQTHTDTQTYSHTNTHTHTNRQTHKETDTQTVTQTPTLTPTHTDSYTHTWRGEVTPGHYFSTTYDFKGLRGTPTFVPYVTHRYLIIRLSITLP